MRWNRTKSSVRSKMVTEDAATERPSSGDVESLQLAKKSNGLDGEFSQFDLRDDYGLEC